MSAPERHASVNGLNMYYELHGTGIDRDASLVSMIEAFLD
jgi:hypothetical protein